MEAAIGLGKPGLVAVGHDPDRGSQVGYEDGLTDCHDLKIRRNSPVVPAAVRARCDDADFASQSQIGFSHIDKRHWQDHARELPRD